MNGDLRRPLLHPKIWREKDAVIGGAGFVGYINAVRDAASYDGDLQKFARDIVVIASDLAAPLKQIEPADQFVEGVPPFIVATPDGIYELHAGCVQMTDGFGVVGAWAYAHGAAALGRGMGLAGFELAKQVAFAVESVTPSVLGPFDWMCTDGSGGEVARKAAPE